MTKRQLKAKIKWAKENMAIIDAEFMGVGSDEIAAEAASWFKRCLDKHFVSRYSGIDIKSRLVWIDGGHLYFVLYRRGLTISDEDLEYYLSLDGYLSDWTNLLSEFSEDAPGREDFIETLSEMGIVTREEVLEVLGMDQRGPSLEGEFFSRES